MLRKVFEQALARGEKITKDLGQELLNSQLVADLANSPRLVNAIAFVIRSKAELSRAVQDRLKGTMEIMNVPTRQQLRTFERRVARLEKELDSLSRKHMRGNGVKPATKTKKAAPKKAVTRAASAPSAPSSAPKKTTKSVKQIKSTQSAPKETPAAVAGRPITVH